MQKQFILAGAVVAGLLPTVAGHAQSADTQPVQRPISIKLGVFLPSDGNVKSAVGNTAFTAGADYAFTKTATASPILPLAYVDYAGKSKNGVRLSFVSVGVGVRAYANRATNTKVAPFYGAGIGAYFLNGSGGGTSNNNTVLGGKVNLGVELNQGPFLEAAYQVTGKYKNSSSNANGLSFMVGDRF